MVELLAIRFGEWLRIEMDDVRHARAMAEASYDEYPGPYAPEAVFENGKPVFDLDTDKAPTKARTEELLKLYAIAVPVDD